MATEQATGWDAAVESKVWDTDKETEGTHRCGRCAGTGMFITYVENGVPRGPGGVCFRCGGKGAHTQADRKRNYWFDLRAIRRYI